MKRTVGSLAWLSIVQYFVAEELVRRTWTLPYSRRTNFISDLGARTCGAYNDRVICSPGHGWMNLSFVGVGAAAATGAWVIRRGAPSLISRPALGAYLMGGAGSIMVGIFPEDSIGWVHVLGASGYFVGANVGHVLVGQRLSRSSAAVGVPLMIIGGIDLLATVLVGAGRDLGLGAGFVERVVAYGADIGFIGTAVFLLTARVRREAARG